MRAPGQCGPLEGHGPERAADGGGGSRGPAAGSATGERWPRIVRRWQGGELFLPLLVAVGLLLAAMAKSSDVALYERYARQAVATPMLHVLPKEYPALSLVVFLLPKALPLVYWLGFGLMAGAACMALAGSSDGLEEHPGWSRRTCIYLLLGTLPIIFMRYDIVPVLAAVLAVEGARRRRWGRAWAWATLGGLLKLFPFLLLPGFLVVEKAQTGKWALRRALAASGPIVVVATAQSLLAPGSAISPLRYEVHRGLELFELAGHVDTAYRPLTPSLDRSLWLCRGDRASSSRYWADRDGRRRSWA